MPRSRTVEKSALAVLAILALFGNPVLAGEQDAKTPPSGRAWVALWQDAYKGISDPQFNPERLRAVAFVDRTTGDAFLCGWNMGVLKSSDGGKVFSRIDGGKIAGPACGPIRGCSVHISPQGKNIAVFNMWNQQGPSGYSTDGGATWESFTHCGRDWDLGAMDWQSNTVLAARHEFDGLHLSMDGGKTWVQLEKSRTKPWAMGLAVLGPKALLVASSAGIERSDDGGKSWAKVSDLGATGPALTFEGKAWWLSGPGKHGVLCSGDGGKTWPVQGEPAPAEVTFGPLFGKDQNHFVVVGRSGFYETTDGCKTWKLAAALPDGFTMDQWGASAAFDPVHDVFYLTNSARPVMRYDRSAPPEYVVPPQPDKPAGPGLSVADAFTAGKAKLRVFCAVAADLNDGFLYLCGEDGIFYFKRDLESGKLKFVEQVPEPKCGGYTIRSAGGRLYGVTPHDGHNKMDWNGLAWFDIDGQTGRPKRAGVVDCPASAQMIVGPGQKDLYLKACRGKEDKLFWYRIGDDGKPAKAGEATGKGIGPSSHNTHPGILVMSPDGKSLYCVSGQDYAIACIQRKPGGEITYRNAAALDQVARRDPDNYAYQWVSLGISPDGKWLYASVRNGKPTNNFYGIFKRDAETGDLTFQETVSGVQSALANLKGWTMLFSPDGTGGYLGSWAGPLATFRYDPATGRLTDAAAVNVTAGNGSANMALDAEKGLLYTAGREFGYDRIFVFNADKPPTPK